MELALSICDRATSNEQPCSFAFDANIELKIAITLIVRRLGFGAPILSLHIMTTISRYVHRCGVCLGLLVELGPNGARGFSFAHACLFY